MNGKEKAECSSTETAGSSSMPTETNNKSPSNCQPFKRPHSLGKAIKRSIRSLPQSPRKRQAVVSGLAKRFGVDMEKEMEASLSTSGNNGLAEEVQNAVRAFYFRYISYTMPGLKDEMTVWTNQSCKTCSNFLPVKFKVFKPSSK